MHATECKFFPLSTAASPPWAVTGDESPEVQAAKQGQAVLGVVKLLEEGRRRKRHSSDSGSSSDDEEERQNLVRKSARLTRRIVLEQRKRRACCCSMTASHLVLCK